MCLKLVFICGSLEPGRDGVGDYVACIARELTEFDYKIAIVALNDRHIKEQIVDFGQIPLMRIPAHLPESERFAIAKAWVDDIDPDIISIQYVAYSFQKKGLPFTAHKRLKRITLNRVVHVMFHELWLDSPKNFKQKVVAVCQKFLIKRTASVLKPSVINVSILFNMTRLKLIGIKSRVLPIFGNITKAKGDSIEFRKKIILPTMEKGLIKILYFGSAPRDIFLQQIVEGLLKFYGIHKGKFQLIVACGINGHKDNFLKQVRLAFNSDIQVVDVGFLSVKDISYLMNTCDAGIGRAEPHLLGKSGSAIAMLEHGMSIWLPKMHEGQVAEKGFRSELVFSDLHSAINNQHKPDYLSLIPEVVNDFRLQFNSINAK